MLKKKIVLFIFAFILFIILLIAIYFFTQEKTYTVTGNILVVGDNYVIIEDNLDNYVISNVKNHYKIGDKVTFTYKIIDIKDEPYKVEATNEKLVEASITTSSNKEESNNDTLKEDIKKEEMPTEKITNEEKENKEEPIKEKSKKDTTTKKETKPKETGEEIKPNNNITELKPTDNNSSKEQIDNNTKLNADIAVLSYVNSLEEDKNNGITDTLKDGFVTVVDFLFYDGVIAGHTFDELTTSAKLEVLKAALWLDDLIDDVFPGYKDTISNGANKAYTSIKNIIVSTYLDITTSICSTHNSLCESAKKDFQDMKNSFGLTFGFIKDLASDGIDKLKDWYEIWREK